ncbi:hypothetical protein P9D43_20265 [Neobacillus niacini]|uniref:hypothetical protein n=1 Tax=Neobacillus niacini TaxID=86668 RepID=UPI00052F9D50|nr:hypothetical protein [Neobacillus niacini]KGM45562.1 hypothetical protein NP83_05330 [Neobacillus niacini]KGM46440.1 hypothetical protein NP83_00165 [Neobacillus niacini]MEC1524338.1 hypothetical protein [Neobacillus niacini]
MKTFLFLLINLMSVISLLGCEQQAEGSIKVKIQMVPNEEYVGNPNPVVKKEMKLTDEEKIEFEKLQKEIQLKNEVE